MPLSAASVEEAARDVARALLARLDTRRDTLITAVEETGATLERHFKQEAERLRCTLEEQINKYRPIGYPISFIHLAGQGDLEKPFNRLLAWWADPKRPASRGFLIELSSTIGFTEMSGDLIAGSSWETKAEESVDDSRKMPDLMVRTKHAALLLENKVSAGESGNQYGPYLTILKEWAGESRGKRAVLCCRYKPPAPDGWDQVLCHTGLAGVFEAMSKKPEVPIWDRIAAAACAVAFAEFKDDETFREAEELLKKLEADPIKTILRLDNRPHLPLPEPVQPWRLDDR